MRQSDEQRASRLELLRRSQQERLDETDEQCGASRQEQLRRSQHERLANETDEQRASRLEQLRRSQPRSQCQQERFADETTCQEALPGIPVPQSR